MCFEGFITLDRDTESRSGLYVTDLPGVTLSQIDGVTKDEQSDIDDTFEYLYRLAQTNLEIDVQRLLAQRFHIDKKLVTRETSAYLAEANAEGGTAGVKISFTLPKYAKINIISIGVYSESAELSPVASFTIRKDDADGELLSTVTGALAIGRNTIYVDEDFEESELFIGFDTDTLTLRKTENKYFPDLNYSNFNKLSCTYPCWYGGSAGVQQINGGGVNVKFVVYCSLQKFICENINLFKFALWYRLGLDLMKERKVSDRVNRFTVLSPERAVELMEVFNEDYKAALDTATANIKMQEDPTCFLCKSPIRAVTSLP